MDAHYSSSVFDINFPIIVPKQHTVNSTLYNYHQANVIHHTTYQPYLDFTTFTSTNITIHKGDERETGKMRETESREDERNCTFFYFSFLNRLLRVIAPNSFSLPNGDPIVRAPRLFSLDNNVPTKKYGK